MGTRDVPSRFNHIIYYIWSIALYGAETWMLRTVDQIHLESFEMGVGRGGKRSVGLFM
jgi:hypothetical protein